MAMKSVAAQNLTQAYSGRNWDYNTWDVAYAGFAGGSLYGVTILRFDVPAFVGVSEGLDLGIVMTVGLGSEAVLRYAVCTSDANREAYMNTSGAVADENQIDAGTITFSGLTSDVVKKTAAIKTTKIKGGSTYYLFLWAYGDTGVSIKSVTGAYGDHSVSIGYNLGVVRLKNKRYMVFVKLGGVARQMIPYVKTPSGLRPGG